ncbi:ABC transporter ATP-binding protein [Propionibacteriaceae bacterium Y1923]
MLRVDDLHFGFRRGHTVLRGVSLDLRDGDSMCLLGPNGTGKTTLLGCLLGLARPTSGTITWHGQNLLAKRRRERARLMAYVPQSSSLNFPYDARDIVLMGRVAHLGIGGGPSARDRRICDEALDRRGIGHLATRIFQTLSGCERQLALLARALAQQARMLVLDEPTAALDFANQVRTLLLRELADEGYAVLMTSHSPDHAFRASNRVLMIRDGVNHSTGPTDEVVTPEPLSQLYGTPMAVVETGIPAPDGTVRVCVPLPGEQPLEGTP